LLLLLLRGLSLLRSEYTVGVLLASGWGLSAGWRTMPDR
jgi:hypothetical protein